MAMLFKCIHHQTITPDIHDDISHLYCSKIMKINYQSDKCDLKDI